MSSAGSQKPCATLITLVIGFLIGGYLGFLLRPTTIFAGQLPFSTVITRGSDLTGLDQLMVPAAQTSFNYMLVGAIVGAVIGYLISRKKI